MHVLLRPQPADELAVTAAADTTIPVGTARMPADAIELDEPPVHRKWGCAPIPGHPGLKGSPARGTSNRPSGVRLDPFEEAAIRFGVSSIPQLNGDPYADNPEPPFC